MEHSTVQILFGIGAGIIFSHGWGVFNKIHILEDKRFVGKWGLVFLVLLLSITGIWKALAIFYNKGTQGAYEYMILTGALLIIYAILLLEIIRKRIEKSRFGHPPKKK